MNSKLGIMLIFVVSIYFGHFATPLFVQIFHQSKKLEKNYRGELIPQGIGMMFSLGAVLLYSLYVFLYGSSNIIMTILFGIFASSFIGFIDDMMGTRDVLGFKGHFKALFTGRLTTGALKAIVGFFTAFTISVYLGSNSWEIFVNTFMMALFINLLNLFDLRPGRAIKLYILLDTFFLAKSLLMGSFDIFATHIPISGIVLGYFPYDIKAKCMMGDAGSNALGISIGILAVLLFSFSEKIIVLAILILIHGFSEKYSISEVIKNNRLLSLIDNWGR